MTSPETPRPAAKSKEPSSDAPDDMPRRRRSVLTREEALTQDAAVQDTLSQEAENLRKVAAELAKKPLRRAYIVGCGDSWFVGIGVRLAFERLLGIPTEAMQALDFALYYHEAATVDTLVIGISSSGSTPAVLNALRCARAQGSYVIGVTNKKGSPLATEFHSTIQVHATRQGWPTQASTAAMAVLIQMALEVGRAQKALSLAGLSSIEAELQQLPALINRTIALSDEPTQELASQLGRARYFLFCGGGPHYAAPAFGAAKIKELAPIHALAIPLEEFHHYRSLKPGDPLFLVAPDEASHQRALDTAEVGRFDGGKIMALVPEGEEHIRAVSDWSLPLPHIHSWLAPILYSIPLHFFAYHLAMRKFELGLGYPSAFPAEPVT